MERESKTDGEDQFHQRSNVVLMPQVGGELTGFSDTKDLTQDERELDAAPGKRTLVFVFPAAVLQDKLGEGHKGHSAGQEEKPQSLHRQ